jgi:hypothetical protein
MTISVPPREEGSSLSSNATAHRRNLTIFDDDATFHIPNKRDLDYTPLLDDCHQRLLKHFLTVPSVGRDDVAHSSRELAILTCLTKD